MRQTSSIMKDMDIPIEVVSQFPTYVGITLDGSDSKFINSLVDITATDAFNDRNAKPNTFNEKDFAFALGLVTHILVNVDCNQLEWIKAQQKLQPKNDKVNFALQCLTTAVYQLDKSDPMLYLNYMMQNKCIIPEPQPINETHRFSRLYSFVFFMELHIAFKQYQNTPHSLYRKTGQAPQLMDGSIINLFQPSLKHPMIVLLPKTLDEIQLNILQLHQVFKRDLLLQIMLDLHANPVQISEQSMAVGQQPFKCGSIEECLLVLLDGAANMEDKYNKLRNNKQFIAYFNHYLIDANGGTYDRVRDQIRQQVEDVIQDVTNKKVLDLFATQIFKPQPQAEGVRMKTRQPH